MAAETAPPEDAPDSVRMLGLSRLMCGTAIVLLAVTHRLWWFPAPLPAIPWLAGATTLPSWVNQGLMVLLVLSLLAGLSLPGAIWTQRWRWGTVSATWGLCLLFDQNRLQPWAWEFWLIATVAAVCPPRDTRRILQGLVISIYVYSAISKIDVVFLRGLGPLMWTGLLRPLGVDLGDWSAGQQMIAAAVLPLGELLVAGLLISRQRRWGLQLSIVQHLMLLVALGPLGLGHEWGVLLWNVFFIVQNVLLFGESPRFGSSPPAPLRRLSRCVFTLIVLFPALEWFGLCDPWPAWAVYCHRPIRVWPLIHVDEVDRLPPSLRSCVDPPAPFSDWSTINLDTWSFREVHVPLYPEGRYRAALFLAAAAEADVDEQLIGLDVQYPSARWTGEREKTRLLGRAAVEIWATQRWANTSPIPQ